MNSLFQLLKKIPAGKVASYCQIGQIIGLSPRQIGKIIHHNPAPSKYPCHRVIKADGSLAEGYAFGGKSAQIAKLKAEGIKFHRNKVPKKYFILNKTFTK